jgi:Uma2 family endonuclease
MGETGIHVNVSFTLLDLLVRFFAGRRRVAVHANMFLYYVEGDPTKNVSPDVFVVFGVPKRPERRTFKVWVERKAPDLVIEVTSRKTASQDQREKFVIYRDVLRVREYILFDPEGDYLEPSLLGYRLVGRKYVRIAEVAGRLPSKVLGLHLERDGLDLRLYDPRIGRWLSTPQEIEEELRESEAARRHEEAARRREEAARREAEAENQRLRLEIEALRQRKKRRP